jgi:large subunit ribosomal protein L43
MQSNEVANKILLLLESSGKKITSLKRKPVVAGSPESARGMWSAMHGARK